MSTQDNVKVYTLNEFDIEMGKVSNYKLDICPVFDKNYTAVCIISSNEYCPYAAVVTKSIIENSCEKSNYDIVILTDDMYQQNIKRIENMAIGYANISVRVFNISKITEKYDFYTWAHFTRNTYYRLLIPDIFDKYEKVIYLDSDIVVNHDIAELYKTDITDYYFGCAYDTHVVSYCTRKPPLEQRKYNIETLGIDKPEEYFQAGVSIINVKLIRQKFEKNYLVKQASKNKLRWMDQDLINMLFAGHIKRIPNKWNVMVSDNPDNIDEYFLPTNLRREYYEARQNPYIIHYVGRAIPCCTLTPDLYEYFWRYARKTVFYEILLQRQTLETAERMKNHILLQKRGGSIIKRILQNGILIKVAQILLPLGTKRRAVVDNIYAKIMKK